MGLFDRLRRQHHSVRQTATAPRAGSDDGAHDPQDIDQLDRIDRPAIERPVQLLLAIGIDGQGPLTSGVGLAEAARASSPTTEEAVARVARTTIIRGATGGYITGVGAVWAMPVALPLNVVEFYVQAARMVSAIATLRGHDVGDSDVRRVVLQTLVRGQTDSALMRSISATRGGALSRRLLHLLPSGALLLANKAIGFRLLYAVAQRLFGRFGRGVPLIGGLVVAARDAWLMRRIAERAKLEFPAGASAVPGDLSGT